MVEELEQAQGKMQDKPQEQPPSELQGESQDVQAVAQSTAQDADATPALDAEDPTQQLLDALEGRAAFYDLLASLYFKPLTIQQIDQIDSMDLAPYAEVNELFAQGLNDIRRYLNKRNSGTRQALAVDFTGAFAGTSSWKGRYAVPYESVFTSEEGLMYQESYHEVYHLFKQNRVARAEGYDYPDDHLSFMCEFLAIVSGRIADAVRAGDSQAAIEQVDLSEGFLCDHILSWFDDFEELALHLLETRFYRGVLKITRGFFQFDLQLLDELRCELQGGEQE